MQCRLMHICTRTRIELCLRLIQLGTIFCQAHFSKKITLFRQAEKQGAPVTTLGEGGLGTDIKLTMSIVVAAYHRIKSMGPALCASKEG